MMRVPFTASSMLCLALATSAYADPMPLGWQASAMAPTGYVRTEGPNTFKLTMKRVGGHWYLIVATRPARGAAQGRPGFEVIDVTDPAAMKSVAHIAVADADGQVTLHDDLLIVGTQRPFSRAPGASVVYPFRGAPKARHTLAVFFDMHDPTHPRRTGSWDTEGWGTHRNAYPGGRYAYMSAWIPGYRGQSVLVILDVSDPAHVREVGRWAQPGQREDEPEGRQPTGYHGPATLSADGKMLTLGFSPEIVNLDITDISHPRLIGSLDFRPLANVGAQAIHTGQPLADPNIVHVSTEPSDPGCGTENMSFAALVDNVDPAHPRLLSYYPKPRPPANSSLKSFCETGGRFGMHNINGELHNADLVGADQIIVATYFSAGVRVFDISDRAAPVEAGWFLPKIGAYSQGFRGLEDVVVDRRGNIFVTDGEEGGVWALRYTGPKADELVPRPRETPAVRR